MKKILTAASIKRFLPREKRWEAPDSACPGLRVTVHPSGAKTFSMRFRGVDGRQTNYILGPVDLSGIETSGAPVKGMPMSLAGARMLGAELNRRRAMGVNVLAEWKAVKHRRKADLEERTTNAFAPLARQFIEQHAKVKTRTWRLSARLLGFTSDLMPLPGGLVDRWRDRPVSEIGVDDIHALINEIRQRGVPGWGRRNGGDSVAWVAHARIAKFFSWLQTERRAIAVNPCSAVRRPDASTPRDRVLSDVEIKLFWKAADELGQPFSILLKLLLVLGQRRAEVSGMRWGELDGDTWTIPAIRVKNKNTHLVPLPTQALDLLSTITSIGETFVFTINGKTPVSGWSKTKARLDAKMAELAGETIPAFTLHDLRRTTATGLQKLGIRLEITEAVLNHSSGSFRGVVGIYQRHTYSEEKRAALNLWSDYVEKLVT